MFGWFYRWRLATRLRRVSHADAATILKSLKGSDRWALKLLISLLTDKERRYGARWALDILASDEETAHNPSSIAYFRRVLQIDDPDLWNIAARGLRYSELNESDVRERTVRLVVAGKVEQAAAGGSAAIDTLIQCLWMGPTESGAAAQSLALLGDERARDPIFQAFEAGGGWGLHGAELAQSLARLGDPRSLACLLKVMDCPIDRGDRLAADCVWDTYGAGALVSALRDRRFSVACAAREALDRHGWIPNNRAEWLSHLQASPKRYEHLDELTVLDLLSVFSDYPELRDKVAERLGALGDQIAAKPLIAALFGNENYAVRMAAATALGKLNAPEAIPVLTQTLATGPSIDRYQGELNRAVAGAVLNLASSCEISLDLLSTIANLPDVVETWTDRGDPPESIMFNSQVVNLKGHGPSTITNIVVDMQAVRARAQEEIEKRTATQ